MGVTVPEGAGPPASAAAAAAAEEASGGVVPVRSPIGGVVLERLVTPGTTVTPGTPLFVVSDLATLWAIAEVDDSHLSRVQAGRPVEVVVAAYPGERFPGQITFIADTVNPRTRRITVRSTVANADGRLKPEMFATMSLGDGDPRTVIVVPTEALQSVGGRMTVFVAGAGGRFSARQVQTGADADGLVEITLRADRGRAHRGGRQLRAQVRADPGARGRELRWGWSNASSRRPPPAPVRADLPGGAHRDRRRRVSRPAGRSVPRPDQQPGRWSPTRRASARRGGRTARHLSHRDGADGRARRRAGALGLEVGSVDRHRRVRRRRVRPTSRASS